MTLVDRLRSKVAKYQAVRDRIGANKADVYRIYRDWGENEIGYDRPQDYQNKIFPSPHIVDLERRFYLGKQGESIEADIMLKGLVAVSFALDPMSSTADLLDIMGNSPKPELVYIYVNNYFDGAKTLETLGNFEFFYQIDGKLYSVQHITKKHLTFDIVLKKTNKQKLYL